MDLALIAGTSDLPLAEDVARLLGAPLGNRELERFPDGECHVRITDSVRGKDVYLLQSTGPPVEANLFELLLLADACRRSGAARLTAVVPYFGYARQDRRAAGREPVSARLIADLVCESGFDRIVAVDLHSAALEGFFSIPLEHLTAVALLADPLQAWASASRLVVVAPDLGAAKLADRYARLLNAPAAIVHKTRLSGREVAARGVTGDVAGRQAVIVDDMISTGATIEAAARALETAGAASVAAVVATHGLFVAGAPERLAAAAGARLIVADTLPRAASVPRLEVVTIAPLLAKAIGGLHEDRSLAELVGRA
ncbi:MAG TPA: ribose-phosphate pyrophosphokinase [Thermoanaerobaculia bacterium]|nr:ribose-phosphate pyrophosphokinase [Thermoanaerobaculia bacterium]